MAKLQARISPSGPPQETAELFTERLSFAFTDSIINGTTGSKSAAMADAEAGDVVSASPVGALASGLVVAYGRVAVDGTVILTLGNMGANTTPGVLEFDVSVERS
jgi:hypothetical protein